MDDLQEIIYPKSKKILALYDSVLKLLEEGRELSSLKVIDITNKAGIGKGTAYEYFKSKDDLISCALIYSLHQSIHEGISKLEQGESFKEKVMIILNFIENNQSIRENILRFINKGILKDLSEHLKEFGHYFTILEKLLIETYALGAKEGLFPKDTDPFLIKSVFCSQILLFLKYLEQPVNKDECEQFKSYLYENLIYLFR
ncbi:hypothetical protein P261_01272 [Lachnospiraceae bacterium TWA4]|nr:hypothetical protein P261_01272 [Lachnospiraceae bacterium TWA4]